MEKNNRYLIDTHIFIWWMEENKQLSKEIVATINNPKNHIFLSVASIWEIIIKQAKHTLKVPKDIEGGVTYSGFTILPINMSHVLMVENLPLYHNDPFDRILIAQSRVEKLTLITDDVKIKKYLES